MSAPEEQALLGRADASLAEARTLAERGMWGGAVSRAYYAMYQSSQALLSRAGVIAKTHKGLRARLTETGLLDREARAILARAQALREQADYDVTFQATRKDAVETVRQAGLFWPGSGKSWKHDLPGSIAGPWSAQPLASRASCAA